VLVSEEIQLVDGISVRLPSGANFITLTNDEARYLRERVERYLKDNRFVNVSDFQDIDKMVVFELFMQRWSLWLSRGIDYYGDTVDARVLAAQLATYSTELRLLKKNLGIDKPSRDRQRGDESVTTYLANLRERAREFGVMRNKQFDKALELLHELAALMTFHDNCDALERQENHVTQEDIFDWLRTIAIPEFHAIDDHFRKSQQRYWIRSM
jgi:hypothetical protein